MNNMNFTDEGSRQLTVEEYFQKEVTPRLFGVSRIFSEARKNMNLQEYKAFAYALSNLDWTKPCPDTLYADKKELAKVIGLTSDIDHLSENLMRSIGDMPKDSFLRFREKGMDLYVNGCFVITVASFRNRVRIRLNPDYLGLFGALDGKERSYITMWSGDIFRMRTERSIKFYEFLRSHSTSKQVFHEGTMSIQKFKEIFEIPMYGPGSYTRNDERHHFNRPEFEKYVIDPVCEDLANTDMIRLIVQADGKYYEKVKKGAKVIAYKFFWTFRNPNPRISEKAAGKESDVVVEIPEEPKELWMSALAEFHFSKEELEAIDSRIRLVPRSAMLSNNAASGSVDLDRYHFVEMRVKDMKVEGKKGNIRNKFKYFLKMVESYVPKAEEDA